MTSTCAITFAERVKLQKLQNECISSTFLMHTSRLMVNVAKSSVSTYL